MVNWAKHSVPDAWIWSAWVTYHYACKRLDIDCTCIFQENAHSSDYARCTRFSHTIDIVFARLACSPSQIVALFARSSILEFNDTHRDIFFSIFTFAKFSFFCIFANIFEKISFRIYFLIKFKKIKIVWKIRNKNEKIKSKKLKNKKI